jgi:hypothetical protein
MAVKKKAAKKSPKAKPAEKKAADPAKKKKNTVQKPAAAKKATKKPAKSSAPVSLTAYSGANPVTVNEMSGGTFVIVAGTARLFFTLDEMRALVKICHIAGSETDASAKLFSWFSAHRTDVLKEVPIKINKDPILGFIYQYLISHYAVKN